MNKTLYDYATKYGLLVWTASPDPQLRIERYRVPSSEFAVFYFSKGRLVKTQIILDNHTII